MILEQPKNDFMLCELYKEQQQRLRAMVDDINNILQLSEVSIQSLKNLVH